ncbi:hypothetical protein UY3_07817 [Chelonia mydas]|uniref:Uncharacterized protein n=1 Tax=Chelonia mydas TaxID=8469 RepID=M7BCV3_CHEMY|nr:hypothetical protein UY3_07817 [Chelonia mydas]
MSGSQFYCSCFPEGVKRTCSCYICSSLGVNIWYPRRLLKASNAGYCKEGIFAKQAKNSHRLCDPGTTWCQLAEGSHSSGFCVKPNVYPAMSTAPQLEPCKPKSADQRQLQVFNCCVAVPLEIPLRTGESLSDIEPLKKFLSHSLAQRAPTAVSTFKTLEQYSCSTLKCFSVDTAVVGGVLASLWVSFENRAPAFREARARKLKKYAPLADTLRAKGYKVQMDALGAWDPCNEHVL